MISIYNLSYDELLSKKNSYNNYIEEIKKIEDKLCWNRATKENTKKAYEEYLLKYFNGIYNFQAKQKIDEFIRLEAKAKELKRRKEIELAIKNEKETWKLVCKNDTKEDYENYLKYYPNGIYANQARENLNIVFYPMHLKRFSK